MYRNILVPVDLSQSDDGRVSLAAALELAAATGAKLHLLNVIADVPNLVSAQLPSDYDRTAMQEAARQVAALAAELGLAEGSYEIDVRHGTIYHEVLSAAKAFGVDLIVIASHKPGLSDYLLGSVAAKVVRHAECSVLVVRSD